MKTIFASKMKYQGNNSSEIPQMLPFKKKIIIRSIKYYHFENSFHLSKWHEIQIGEKKLQVT